MDNKDHDLLIRIDTKLDSVLAWIKMHDSIHARTRIVVWGVLIAAIVSIVLSTT